MNVLSTSPDLPVLHIPYKLNFVLYDHFLLVSLTSRAFRGYPCCGLHQYFILLSENNFCM